MSLLRLRNGTRNHLTATAAKASKAGRILTGLALAPLALAGVATGAALISTASPASASGTYCDQGGCTVNHHSTLPIFGTYAGEVRITPAAYRSAPLPNPSELYEIRVKIEGWLTMCYGGPLSSGDPGSQVACVGFQQAAMRACIAAESVSGIDVRQPFYNLLYGLWVQLHGIPLYDSQALVPSGVNEYYGAIVNDYYAATHHRAL